MASLQQKRPSISNWFSSLRRQPKNKKSSNSSLYGPDKQYQRSCIDLSSSTFYVPPSNQLAGSNGTATTPGTANNSTDNLLDSATSMSNVCVRCCCAILPKSISSRSQTPPSTPNTTSNTLTPDSTTPSTCTPPRSPSLNPYASISSCDIATKEDFLTPATMPPLAPLALLTPTTPTQQEPHSPYDNVPSTSLLPANSFSTYETEIRKTVELVRLASNGTTDTNSTAPNSPLTPSTIPTTPVKTFLTTKPICLTQRTEEFTRTKKLTITQSYSVSTRPVQILYKRVNHNNNNPEKSPEKTQRSNSLGCVLDNDVVVAHSELKAIGSDSNFKYIDDSSTSQSETERNSENSQKGEKVHIAEDCFPEDAGHYSVADKENYYNSSTLPRKVNISAVPSYATAPRSMSVSSTLGSRGTRKNCLKAGLYDNKSVGSLCDDCRMVIKRNRTNRECHFLPVINSSNKQIKDELCEVVSEMEALDVPEDSKHSNKDKQMSIGRKKFNMDPKKGIEHLVEHRLLRHDPQDVAHFLYKGEGLNKTAIGDFLGENNDFNKDVLKAFVALHDFTNLILVQALRQFLWSFRLPGEAQKIDRMMECFAQRYCQLNPDIFTNTDTCYVLSFAIIMLNTSLHNPSVKDKPSVEQFISMNRGINNGGDLPRELLESLYESIRTEPFKIPQDDGNDLMHTFFNPDKEGWLWKQGGRYKSWKRRWFILNDNCLYYFEYTTDKEPRGIIPLENISVREIHDRSKPNCFELFAAGGAEIIKACKTDSEGKVVEGKHSVYRMSAGTEEDQQEWIERITQSISHNPFYDILVQRKKKALSKS